jgi:hypothetical protein
MAARMLVVVFQITSKPARLTAIKKYYVTLCNEVLCSSAGLLRSLATLAAPSQL